MSLPPSFRAHKVTLEPLLDNGRYGPTYAPPVPISGVWVEVGRKLVPSSVGEEIVSSARVWLDPAAPTITPGDRVTLPSGHAGLAITVDAFDSPVSLAHVEVAVS